MADISSSIRIEDGFTEPLKNLAKASWEVDSGVTAVAKSLLEQQDCIKDVALESVRLGKILKNDLPIGYKTARGSVLGFVATLRTGLVITNRVAMSSFNKLKDSYINGFNSLMESIGKSIDEINIGDKLNAQFDNAGDVARRRAYALANDIGESATMISELAMKAGQEGIGTEHFERMMKLADKVGKLRQGETTESAASVLMSNIKSGHDASSISQLFGGGQLMERQLRRSGYERALNNGNLDRALEIAEQIAKQAGLTDENYNNATNNLSQNYKKIMNTIDNVKRRLAETFNRTFAPTIEKIKKLLESNTFKTVVNVADWLMEKLGKFLNWFTESAVDNIRIIAVMLGVGIGTKLILIIPRIKLILLTASKLRGPIGWIAKGITNIIGGLVSIITKQGIIAVKAKAIAALKVAGPWVAAGAAVAGITYGIYKLTGTTKTFTGWLKGVLAAAFTGAKNVFTNVFIFFDRIADYIKALPELFKAASEDIANELSHSIDKALGKKKIKYEFVGKEELAKMSYEEKKGLVQNGYGQTFRKIELSDKYISKTDEILNKIHENQMKYIDVTEGMEKAYETEGASTVEWLKKLFNQGEEQTKEQKGIATDTGKIRQFGEQEEELKWIKAFSDRQIMSAYNSQTTNNRTINMNGVSQNTMAEAYRRNRSTVPARAMM